MRHFVYVVLVSVFLLCTLGIPAGAEEQPSERLLSALETFADGTPTKSANVLNEESGNNSQMAGAPASPSKFSNKELMVAVENVLQERPDLILAALEKNPVALEKLVERASQIRQAQAEEEQWLAELKYPKVPEINEDRPVRGSLLAPVTIVEYSDFECPYCQAVSPTLMDVFREYEGKVRFVYKHNPLSFHPTAEPAARYFEAIALQNQTEAWRFHDRVFEEQHNLTQGVEVLKEIAAGLEIDHKRLERDLDSDTVLQRLAADLEEAKRFGFDGTPAFVINGVSLIGNHPKEDFVKIIKLFVPDRQET